MRRFQKKPRRFHKLHPIIRPRPGTYVDKLLRRMMFMLPWFRLQMVKQQLRIEIYAARAGRKEAA